MPWHIRRIVHDGVVHRLVARRDEIAPEFISFGPVIHAINRKVCLGRASQYIQADSASWRGLIQAFDTRKE
jgi:hypothetical protein